MIKTIIKRDGSREAFDPAKLNGWAQFSAKTLGGNVDWTSIVLSTVSALGEEVSSQTLQERLIKACLDENTWSYNRMAGRLYASMTYKQLYDDKIPTIARLHRRLVEDGFMIDLGYSVNEYAEVECAINHKLDFKASYFELQHIRKKYALQNRITGQEYESQQFVYMRMAMALASHLPEGERVQEAIAWYKQFSEKKVNAPTPNYVNLGTPLRGFASCNVYTTLDSAQSLAVGDHIAYIMTCMSAGIGSHINTRSAGDPVRNGRISHQGKLPYYRALVGAVHANIQAGRGGACTVYYSAFDPEVETIAQLKNPMSTEDKKIRGLDYAFSSNKFFAKKAAANENIFAFNSFNAPDLWDAFYSADEDEFERIYTKYEKDGSFEKRWINARDLLLIVLNEAHETGRAYQFFPSEVNHHTPFKDKIYSSNLCFTGDTLVAVADGRNAVPIKELSEQPNGEGKFLVYSARPSKHGKHRWVTEIKEAVAQQTGIKEIIEITLSNGSTFRCTPDHQLALAQVGMYVKAMESAGMKLQPFFTTLNGGEGDLMVIAVEKTGEFAPVYDLTVEDNHNFYIITGTRDEAYLECSGILVHNCTEIMLPTHGYKNMQQLYSGEELGMTILEFENYDLGVQLPDSRELNLEDGSTIKAYNAQVGQTINMRPKENPGEWLTISKVHHDQEPEIGLCSLAGICVDHIQSDEEYESAMYYALKMIDRCIDMSEYVLPHLGVTARARRSAGVGILGLAHYMAQRHLSYTTQAGKDELHRLAERHMYFAINASVRLARELGAAKWMYKTKWVDGWLPIDAYNRNVDQITQEPLHYDWEALRAQVKQYGLRHSVLVATPPSESSSIASGTTNSVYPVRSLSLIKGDANKMTYWAAPEGERLGKWYDIAWHVPQLDMIQCYAILQKFADQGISADLFVDATGEALSSSEMLRAHFAMVKYGLKSRYYTNTLTTKGIKLEDAEVVDVGGSEEEAFCESCTL